MLSMKNVIDDKNPLIREKSLPVSLPLSKEDEQLLREMYQYVQDSIDEEKAEKMNLRPAVGISAIQVGVKKQMTAVVVDDLDKNGEPEHFEYMLVNPRIVSSSVQKAYLHSGEGCLSVVNQHDGYVVRSARITVKAFDLCTNKDITIRARGYLAIVLQHEIDHFSGILFYDHINKKDPFKEVEGALVI